MSSPLPQSRLRVQRIAEAAVERARLTVVPRRRVQAPRVPFIMLVSLVLLGGVVGLLMFNTTMQQHAFTASELEATATEMRAQEQALKSELEELRDPQTVGDRAKELGMVLPGAPAFLQLQRDGGRVTGGSDEPVGLEFDPSLPVAAKPRALIPDRLVIRAEPRQVDAAEARASTRERARARSGDTQRGARANRP